MTSLTSKHVDGVLMDAYTASSIRQSIDRSGADPVKLVDYPRYYGVVLSGNLAHIGKSLEDNIRSQDEDIMKIIEQNTNKIKVFTFVLFSLYNQNLHLRVLMNWIFECVYKFTQIGISTIDVFMFFKTDIKKKNHAWLNLLFNLKS